MGRWKGEGKGGGFRPSILGRARERKDIGEGEEGGAQV